MLRDLFEYYLENQNDIVEKYNGKCIVIKDYAVVGAFNTEEEAYFDSLEKYEQGTFIIQKCSPGEKDYTQMFHSRVAFA